MPDMLLSQIPPAPAPAKPAAATARAADANPETESDQGFSDVLKAQMQPEKETAQTEAEHCDEAVETSVIAVPADAAEGNPLPPGGKVVTASLAALDPLLMNVEAVPQAGEAAVETPVETAILIPGLAVETQAEPIAQTQVAPPGVTKPQPPAAAGVMQMRGAPWKTGAADLPDAAQSAVAQAVRSAVTELDENAQPELTLERFGAEVRAAATAAAAPVRAPGLETMLERLTSTGAQATTASNNSVTPQGLQALVPQDAANTRPALPTATVETPLRQPGWDQALSEKVLWVANQKFQGAEIKLSPAHLGPIEVRVQLNNDQAQISFTAQHAPAREALEAALPRLREMFTANGYNLVDVNVSQHSFAEQQRHAQGFEGRFQGGARNEDDVELASGATAVSGRLTGLPSSAIDLFA